MAVCLLVDAKAAEADVPTDGPAVKLRPNPVMLAALRISQNSTFSTDDALTTAPEDGFYVGDHSAFRGG
jgi:hypothetical protein